MRIAADIYNSTFLKIIGSFTWGILEIVPKDGNGNPIEDLKTVRVDADRQQPGIQELSRNGKRSSITFNICRIPIRTELQIFGRFEYRGKLGRNIRAASWNPYQLLKRCSYVTWIGFGVMVFALFIVLMLGRMVAKRIRK